MTNVASNANSAAAGEAKQIVIKEIQAKWGKFSDQDLSALKSNGDLVTQLAAKYSLEKSQAQRDVDRADEGPPDLTPGTPKTKPWSPWAATVRLSRGKSRQMTILDYSTEAELYPTAREVELSPVRRRKTRQPIGYGRFARAADAIRFAIEELPPELLLATHLKVADEGSTATQFAGCTRVSNIRWRAAPRTGEQ